MRDDDTLHVINASAHAPTVSITGVNPLDDGTTLRLSWSTADADGDTVRATVLFSADGREWRPLATGVDQPYLDIDTSTLPGTSQGQFRILVTDGLLGADTRTTEPVAIADHAPELEIYRAGDVLEALSWDAEDGELDVSHLRWESDRDGALGAGDRVLLQDLKPGRHSIRLTGTDSRGNQGTTELELMVGGAAYLPTVRVGGGGL
jgi:hypothetical protein